VYNTAVCDSLFQTTGDDILKKRAERFSMPISSTSHTVASQPVCIVTCEYTVFQQKTPTFIFGYNFCCLECLLPSVL